MVFKASLRCPGDKKLQASPSPQTKTSRIREEGRENKEEELKEDQQNSVKAKLLSLPPSPSAPMAMAAFLTQPTATSEM
jgi:hypothetical protein